MSGNAEISYICNTLYAIYLEGELMNKEYRANGNGLHTEDEASLIRVGKVFGNDDRKRVTDMEKAPYNAIVRLLIIVNKVQYLGTGFMIKPGVMLTAGHNIYDHDAQKYSDEVYVLGKDGTRYKVYDAVIPEEFKTYRVGKYDWAVTKVAVLPGVTVPCLGYLNMDASDVPDPVGNAAEVAGYPVEVRGVTTQDMYTETGNITAYDRTDKLLNYTIDTSGGNSGSPVIVYKDTVPYAIGIHVRNSENCNIAKAIDDTVVRAINALK